MKQQRQVYNAFFPLIKVIFFLVLVTCCTLLLHAILMPYIEPYNLIGFLVDQFGKLLPERILKSIFTRIIFFVCVTGIYLVFHKYIDKKSLQQTLFSVRPIVSRLLLGVVVQTMLYVTAFILGCFINLNTFEGFTQKPLTIVFSALLLDMIIKFPTDLGEELAFRGYTITSLLKPLGPHLAVLFSATAFALFHVPFMPYNLSNSFFHLLFGLLTGYVFLIFNNIYLTTGMHLGANVISNHLLGYGNIIKGDASKNMLAFIMILAIAGCIFYYSQTRNKR